MLIPAVLAFSLAAETAGVEPKVEPKRLGFSPRFIDSSADPCKSFYQYACGNWLKENPTPPEYASWGRFAELGQRNLDELRKILETAAAKKEGRSDLEQKIGDFYATCMDEGKADALGARPLEKAMVRIAVLKTPESIVLEAANLRRSGTGVLFSLDSTQDARNAKEMIAEADQGGLGLPDRDYYTKDDDKSKKLRAQYVEHVTKMFVLAGDDGEKAAREAKSVMEIETALAKGAMTRVERRDPEKRYNRMKLAELKTLAPRIPWADTFKVAGLPPVDSINIGSPGYFKALDGLLASASIDDWKSYLRWHVVHRDAAQLSVAFVNENFRFYGTTLTGAKALQPRWKRCVTATDQSLRDLLGKPYVDATFGAEGKKRMLEMVAALLGAMEEDLGKLSWMDDATKVLAKAKLGTFIQKIGYPDRWVDYGAVKVTKGDLPGNVERARRFAFDRELAKVGKPVDKNEWGMTPPTVNAYYNPQFNEIVFPAGILQPPFYENGLDDAPNFGGIGGVIGHEISHGFDDQGSQYDKDGNLKNWWTEKASVEFKRRAGCVEKQFSEYVAVDDVKVNGKLTLGENIGDLGGLKLARMALAKTLEGKPATKIDGFTPDQRFFLGWGQVWCRNTTPEDRRLRAQTDPHAPAEYRVDGPLSNMKEFQSAFQCPDDAPMVRKVSEVCEVW